MISPLSITACLAGAGNANRECVYYLLFIAPVISKSRGLLDLDLQCDNRQRKSALLFVVYSLRPDLQVRWCSF
jgi:hypothetical protein